MLKNNFRIQNGKKKKCFEDIYHNFSLLRNTCTSIVAIILHYAYKLWHLHAYLLK